ncbi:MAG TPA: hypothetical protein PKG93_03015 [Bacilli bacterium]|nr:hypothetical protein [Bacilli bacterium]
MKNEEIKVVKLNSIILNDLNKLSLNKNNAWSITADTDILIPQHLYILSNEPLIIGDWYYIYVKSLHSKNDNSCIAQITAEDINSGLYEKWKNSCQKIIATTDNTLNIPQIEQKFVQHYINEYNTSNTIENVLVELTLDDYDYRNFIIKVNELNQISIYDK